MLENPDTISKTVLKKVLDAGTAYEILSIDIADVDVVIDDEDAFQAQQLLFSQMMDNIIPGVRSKGKKNPPGPKDPSGLVETAGLEPVTSCV